MRALLIPADDQAPRLVDLAYDGTDYRAVAEAIGATWVEYVNTHVLGVALIVDEEGFLVDRPANRFVSWRLYPGLIAGDVLVFSELAGPAGRDITDLSDGHLAVVAAVLGLNPEELQP